MMSLSLITLVITLIGIYLYTSNKNKEYKILQMFKRELHAVSLETYFKCKNREKLI